MIPQQLTLEGFLSYKGRESIAFDEGSLWMLTGPNGSGKSTLFDAVTYTLFGQHRGGGQDAQELINKECEKARVEFEFTLGNERFVAQRTVQRTKHGKTKGTQQLYRVGSDGTKEPLEGSHLKSGFDEWVTQNIGLSYDVFTSSVLLLQGKAERLLDSTAKGRFDVLAGIVDLERYERLHKRAEDERRSLKDRVEGLRQQVERLLEVTPLELAEAEAGIETAEEERVRAQQEVARLQTLEFQAHKWVDLQARLCIARQRWQQAKKLLDDAAAIEQDVNRLAELRDVLPRLETLVGQRGQIQESEAKTKELASRGQQLTDQLAIFDNNLGQTRQKVTSLKKLVETDEKRHREVTVALREADAQLTKLEEYERHENDLNGIRRNLARMPADPAAALQKARDEHDALTDLAQAMPVLARFQMQREQLREAQTRQQAASQARDTARTRGEQCRAEVDAYRATVDSATKAVQDADAQATAAKTLLDQAREQLDDLGQLYGAKVCRHCGQKLTEAHIKEEKARRQQEVAQAETVLQRARTAQREARRAEQQARDQFTELERKLESAREEFKDLRAQAEQAGRDVERLQLECGQSWSELSDTFQRRISAAPPADWSATSYPMPAELTEARQQANELKAARRRLSDAEKVFTEWNTFKGLESQIRQNLTRLEAGLPADRQKVRSEHTRLGVEDKALTDSLAARRQELDGAQRDLNWLTEERGKTDKQLSDLQGSLRAEEAAQRGSRQAVARALKELPESWRSSAERAGMADLFRWRGERDQLVEKQTDDRGSKLAEARVGFQVMRKDLADLEEQEQAFPAETRQEPEQIAGVLRLAREAVEAKADAVSRAKHNSQQLEARRGERERLQQELRRAERDASHAEILAKLLGRDRLQLHLVRQAERQVVDHANAVLDRLSGGQLYLRLVGAADGDATEAKALEMEAHNRTTADRPINVKFLSGSQKFRVAVSLALGLGQYASRQHRPIESVIIDEGFGCLDKEGRQAMIQELQNLRGQLRCILLVSHQEEFADAFADGYRFELADGSTRVTRFQK